MLDSNAQFEVVGVEVPSGVSHTPASREELMAGARFRAEALVKLARERGEPWKYFVGLEGGLDVVQENGKRVVFLQSWAYVTDGNSPVHSDNPARCKCRSRLRRKCSTAAPNFPSQLTRTQADKEFATRKAHGEC